MVADYEEKHAAPPKLKRGPLDGVERMTPALAAWEEQKLKLQARLEQQKEVERIAREAAGVFEPDWDASSSSSSSSSSPGVQNQKKKKTGTPAKGLETGSFDKREPDSSFDKRELAASSSASFDKRGALDVTPLLRTPQRWRKTNRHRIAVDWFNTTYLARCNGVPPENVEALQKLNSHGFDLVLLSYCGWRREQEVKSLAWQLPVPWEALHFTRAKAGVDGKCAWLEHLHCGRIIDDDVDVLWEAQEKGYQYYAIQTPKKRHEWCRRGAYPGLPEAVEAILAGQWQVSGWSPPPALTKGWWGELWQKALTACTKALLLSFDKRLLLSFDKRLFQAHFPWSDAELWQKALFGHGPQVKMHVVLDDFLNTTKHMPWAPNTTYMFEVITLFLVFLMQKNHPKKSLNSMYCNLLTKEVAYTTSNTNPRPLANLLTKEVSRQVLGWRAVLFHIFVQTTCRPFDKRGFKSGTLFALWWGCFWCFFLTGFSFDKREKKPGALEQKSRQQKSC